MKSLNEMEELKRVQGSRVDEFSRRRLTENQDTIHELTAKIQEVQNEVDCVNDSRDFQDAESVRSGHSHVTSQPVSFPPHPVPGGMLSRSIGMPSRREGPASTCDTHGFPGNFFADLVASSTALYPQVLNPWSSGISEPIHSSSAGKNESQTPVQDQRCQSGSSHPAGRHTLPLSWWIGTSERTSQSACWASWADSLAMIYRRHRGVATRFLECLTRDHRRWLQRTRLEKSCQVCWVSNHLRAVFCSGSFCSAGFVFLQLAPADVAANLTPLAWVVGEAGVCCGECSGQSLPRRWRPSRTSWFAIWTCWHHNHSTVNSWKWLQRAPTV